MTEAKNFRYRFIFGGMFLPGLFAILSTQNVMRLSYVPAWVLVGVLTVAHAGRAWGSQVPYGYTLNGQPVTGLAPPGTEAIVLFFTATDCPISNRYIPEIQLLEKKYAAQHVAFWFIYPNVGETAARVRQHEADYGTEAHVLLDPHHRLVELTRATVTPEAAILIPPRSGVESLRIVYHGRIDNRYIQIGQQRPKATQYDLERAISDVLQHRPVHRPDGSPVGCGIIGQP